MTSQTRGTEKVVATSGVDLDRDPRAIVGTREFNAPRALVFSAWTDPKTADIWRSAIGDQTTLAAINSASRAMHCASPLSAP